MATRRRPENIGLPPNLTVSNGYFAWKDPNTGLYYGVGRGRAKAILQAKAANLFIRRQAIAQTEQRTKTRLARKLLASSADEHGLLSREAILANSIARKSLCGIYFLIAGGKIIYVGQSVDCHTRMRHHEHGGLTFDSYFFIEVEPSLLDDVEAAYIAKLNPELNKQVRRVPQRTYWGAQNVVKLRDVEVI